MLSVLIGLSMFVAVAQEPPADADAVPPEAAQEQQAETEAREAAEETNGEADSAKEEEGQVCRRRTTFDMMGRQRSRKVCRPR